MKSKSFFAGRTLPKCFDLAFFSMLLFVFFLSGTSYGKSGREIDASVDVALERFYRQVDGAREFAKNAKGLLVLPNVKKGGIYYRWGVRSGRV